MTGAGGVLAACDNTNVAKSCLPCDLKINTGSGILNNGTDDSLVSKFSLTLAPSDVAGAK